LTLPSASFRISSRKSGTYKYWLKSNETYKGIILFEVICKNVLNNLDFFIDSKISLYQLIERFPISFLDILLKVSEGLAISHTQPQHGLEDSEMRFKVLISILLS
jgi:hypothetical protein